jgi:cyclophilin family peptidyl-prolyl cis-trans isomerase
MIMMFLSPIAVLLTVILILKTFHGWRVQESELENVVQAVEQEASSATIQTDNGSTSNVRKPSKQQPKPTNDAPDVSIQSQQHARYTQQEALVLTTEFGKIRIVLLPVLSPESVDSIYKLVESGVCKRCNFYRAEKPGILQGAMANPDVPANEKKGPCPEGLEDTVDNDCPDWDKQCGCHGPIMTQGSVGWAGGHAGGPDFFINNYEEPAKFWGTQHTNFGKIHDADSFAVIGRIFDQPTKKQGMMRMLENPVHFDLSIEPVGDLIAVG